MKVKEILELVKSLSELEVSEVELELEGLKLRVKKELSIQVPVKEEKGVPSPAFSPVGTPATLGREEAPHFPPDAVVIRSPIVGTFYRAPSPDALPYVDIGNMVNKGQTLCIIEAMKIMNEIESEVKGEILDILVENAESVEYSQPLFLVRPTS